jgi:hypothetical protein
LKPCTYECCGGVLCNSTLSYRDPAAINNSTLVPINCTGTAVSKPNSLLQRLLLPVLESDVVNVEEKLQTISPAKEAQTTGRTTPSNAASQGFVQITIASHGHSWSPRVLVTQQRPLQLISFSQWYLSQWQRACMEMCIASIASPASTTICHDPPCMPASRVVGT